MPFSSHSHLFKTKKEEKEEKEGILCENKSINAQKKAIKVNGVVTSYFPAIWCIWGTRQTTEDVEAFGHLTFIPKTTFLA